MKIPLPEKCCNGRGDENSCIFFKSNYCDEDSWYSGNPLCLLHKKSLKNDIQKPEEACEKDDDYFFNVDKPDFCKVTEIIVVTK